MDKDDSFKLLYHANSVSFEEYFLNQKWQEESALICQPSTNQKEKEYKVLSYVPKDKAEKAESNIMKSYSHLIEDSYYLEKSTKEVEEMMTEKTSMLVTSVHEKNDDFFERKVNLYNMFMLGYSGCKSSINMLTYYKNPLLEKHLFSKRLLELLKDSSTYEALLGDFTFEEVFHQPWDVLQSKDATNDLLEVIHQYDDEMKESDKENAFRKSVMSLLAIGILKGDFCKLYLIIYVLSQLKHKEILSSILTEFEENEKVIEQEHPVKDKEAPIQPAKRENILLKAITSLFRLASENNYLPYPIMRNYSVVDYFNISQVILYAKGKQPFSDCSICTDGSYIYAIITGINGCKMKIGTGYNGTTRGKVYKHVIMSDEASYQWVYCQGKIYLKTYSSIFPLKEFGYLRVISPETLEEEGKIKLILPKNINHSLVSMKNENFVLLSDGKRIGILVLEPSSSNDLKEDNKEVNSNSNEDLLLNSTLSPEDLIKQIDHLYGANNIQYKYINLELITYDPQPKRYSNDIKDNVKALVSEIYMSFSAYYSIDECYKALVKHKWNVMETAEYLSGNPIEIHQTYLEGNDPLVLFQSKFELSSKPGKPEKVMFSNPFFDVIQFNQFKWSFTDEYVIAHQFKEGAAVIFSRSPADSKLFTYSTPLISLPDSTLLKDLKDIKITEIEQLTSKIQQLKELFEKKTNELKHAKEIQSQTLRGTLIKASQEIQLTRYDYLSTYDQKQKCYYLLTTVSLSSLSILVVDSFIPTALKLNQMMFNNTDKSFNEMNSFFSSIISNKAPVVDFDALLNNIFNLMLILASSKKYDSYSRYSNWSFTYDQIIDSAIKQSEKISLPASSSSYSSSSGNNDNYLPSTPFKQQSTLSKKNISMIMEKLASYYKEKLFTQIPRELQEKCEVIEIPSSTALDQMQKKKSNKQYPCSSYLKNSGNWMDETLLMFKPKEGTALTIEEIHKLKDNVMIMSNNKTVYMSIDGEISSIDYLINMYYQSNSKSTVLYSNKAIILNLIYLWVSNCNDSVAITNQLRHKEIFGLIDSIIEIYLKKKEKSSSVIEKGICLRILLEGWEHLASDYDSQMKWFVTLFEYQRNSFGFEIQLSSNVELNIIEYGDKYPFTILLQKMDMCRNANALLNNFNKVNMLKSYSFYPLNYYGEMRVIAKPSFHSLASRHIQYPFYWGLLEYNLNKLHVPSDLLSPINYGIKEKSEGNCKQLLSSSSSKTVSPNSKDRNLHSIVSRIPNTTMIDLYRRYCNDVKEESLWSFIKRVITPETNQFLLDFLNKMLVLLLADLNRIYNEYLKQGNSSNPNDNDSNSQNEKNAFIEKHISFLIKAHANLKDLSAPIKSISYLNLYTTYIYNIFSKISNSTLKTLTVLKELLTKAQADHSSIASSITLLNEPGTQMENSKMAEYLMSNEEMTMISKKISFDSNIIEVYLDFKIAKSEGKNYRDIVCMSEYHASTNCLTNNINKYGTCYQTQLNANFEKVFYLKGKEVKIISPSTILHNKGTVSKFSAKSFLKIKAYPYNNQFALIEGKSEMKEEEVVELISSLSLLQDIEYFTALIDKNMLKSFDIDKDEVIKKDSIAKLGFKSYQEALNSFEYYYHNVPYSMSNYNASNVFTSTQSLESEQKEVKDASSYEIEGFVQLVRQKIREKTLEPNDFIFIQKLPSFTPEYKAKWRKVELALLHTLLYHLGIYDDFKKAFEKNNLLIIEPFFSMLGKKLNVILSQMASKAKEFKHSYDTIKSNIDDFIIEYAKKYEEKKEMLCAEIKMNLKKETRKKRHYQLYDGKSTLSQATSAQSDNSIQPPPKARRHSITFIKKPKKANQKNPFTLEEESDKDKENLNKRVKSNFINESIGDLAKSFKYLLSQETMKSLNDLKDLYKSHKKIIEDDMQTNLYGNIDKIKQLCDEHGLVFNESNPSESIKLYSKHIYDQFSSMLPLKDINSFLMIDRLPLESSLNEKSPFNTVAQIILDKALFLLSLNHYDEMAKEDFPFLERLPSITRENSRTSSTRRTKSKNSEDNNSYLLNRQQLIILRSVMIFFSSQNESLVDLRYILNKQFIRARIRSRSLMTLANSLSENMTFKNATNYILGIISSSIKGDIRSGIESAILDNSQHYITKIVTYYLNSYISTLTELNSPTVLSSSKESNKGIIIQVSNFQSSSEGIDSKTQKNLLLKRAFLALSDMNILFKEIKRNLHNYNGDNGYFDVKLYSTFIMMSLKFLFEKDNTSSRASRIKKYCDDLIKIILSKMLSIGSLTSLSSLSETIFNELSNELTRALDSKDEESIAKVLKVIHQLIHNCKDTTCMSKLSSTLLDLIEQSDRYEIISLASRLFLQLFKVANQTINVSKLFTKIGKLFLFKCTGNIEQIPITQVEGPYNIMIQMNSTEIDYQFLVNALYYWEEKYPSILTSNNQVNYPLFTVNEEGGYKVEKYSYFNVLKAKTNKMHLLDSVVNEKLAGISKSLTEANTAKAEKPDDTQIDENIERLKNEEKYQERIRAHIRLAQEIGENATIRGFAVLDPPLPASQAKEFAEMVHKANNRLLPHFKASLTENATCLFSDDIIYPKMPKKEVMAPGCMNTLKETTKSYVNVTLINREEFSRLKANWITFVELAKKNHIPEDKKVKSLSALKHFIPDISQNTLQTVNYNDQSIPKIISQDSTSGASITISIETLLHLIYSAYQKDLNGLIKQIRIRLQKIKDDWHKDADVKFNSLGMLIVAADYFKILHKNSKVQMNNNICHIISGGDKSGQTTSDIIYPITTGTNSVLKIERIQTDLLDKYEHNSKLLSNIPFGEIADAILFSCDLIQNDKEALCNKNLQLILLKILNMKKIEAEDVVNYIKKKKESFDKLFTFLNSNSNEAIWLEQEDKALEIEFIESFERIYNKMDVSNQRIYSPSFILDLNTENKYFPIPKVNETTDIITNSNLPQTNYVKQVPKLSDFSKSNDVLKNIQIFDRYLVMEIFNYCKTHYRDSEYENSLTQVRNHIANGDLKNAIIDLNTIFDDRQSAPHITLLKDYYDSKEITKEEIYPGNFYLAKLTKKFMGESKVPALIQLERVGVFEVTVLVLIQDNALNQALVLFSDDDCGKIISFWLNSDQLMFNAKPIKMASSSFPLQLLLREYKYLHKRLSILYAKNSLNDIMNSLTTKQSIYSGNDLINCLILNNWKKFKLNPMSGVYHIFNNFIVVKKTDSLDKVYSSQVNVNKESNDKRVEDNLISELMKGLIGHKDGKDSEESNNNEILLDRIISSFAIDNKAALDIILKWCMTQWSSMNKEFHSIALDLFTEYTTSKDKLRSKDMFHIGILNNKHLALHELFSLEKIQHCGIILTFDKKAYLSPHARLTFYSDPYGENIIHELASIKTVISNLPICVLNYPKVWVNYMPGTSSFEGRNWDANTCNSSLPCTISLIPYYWSPLIQLTDYSTSAIFNDIKKESINYYQLIIRELIIHCLEMSLPAEIQRRIFNLTNRAILKCFKFISLLESQIKYNQKSISEKLSYIGIEEQSMIRLITKINSFTGQSEDKALSSAYLVEGVEILLSLLSFIQVPYTVLDNYLRTNYKFELPIWIEAIMKLGQFLTYMQGNNMLEANVASEISEQLKISNQFNNILMIQLKEAIGDDDKRAITMNCLKGILEANDVMIVDYDKDVLMIDKNRTVVLLIDGMIIKSLNKEEDKKEEEKKEEPFWMCADCTNENDKDNTRCVFCDAAKRVKPKEKKPKKIEKKSHLVKENLELLTLTSKMDSLKANLSEFFKGSVITQCDDKKLTQSPYKETLNAFLYIRLQLYKAEKESFNERKQLIKSSKGKSLMEALESSQESKMIEVFTSMMTEKINFWFEDTSLPKESIEIDIALMERIREIIDKNVSKDSKYSLILSPIHLRVLPYDSNGINHSSLSSLHDVPLSLLRYYWAVIKYFNKCLEAALPYIKPPDYYSSSVISSNEEGYVTSPFPRTISAFLSSARGIMFSYIKSELIKEVLLSSEFSENEIQTPKFKFERLAIANSIEKKQKNQKRNRDNDSNNSNEDEDEDDEIQFQYQEEDSMFLQAYEQYKNLDPAFFRIQKVKGDPHIAFKVEFKGELVQGLGGPYRQFFSDISSELTSKLSLLQPTSNNSAKKGDYQDKYTIASGDNTRAVLSHYEFLGFLMGICIRTGVRLTIDLTSIVWKKLIDEVITLNDIYQFDEGLYAMIKILTDPHLTQEQFKSDFNLKYEIELNNGFIKELIANGSNIAVSFNDRIKYVQLVVKHRLSECDTRIDAVRKGIAKIIPISLLKLLTYKEIERLVCGNKTVDIDLLKRNTKLSFDLTEESNKVKWLWEILKEISDEDKVKFIKFCWAQERLPSSDEEFSKLQVTFTIKSYTDKNKIDVFPKADTCFFHLELPEYSSKEVMKKKLLQAISLDNVGMNADKVIAEPQGRFEANARRNYHHEEEEYYDYDDYID